MYGSRNKYNDAGRQAITFTTFFTSALQFIRLTVSPVLSLFLMKIIVDTQLVKFHGSRSRH